MVELVIKPSVPAELIDESNQVLCKPDRPLCHRRTSGATPDSQEERSSVDTYGGSAPHGGGAFSGKDPTKVDRSAAYASRYVAKNIVAAGLADKCLVQLAYAIGIARPVSVMVDTYGTGKVSDEKLAQAVNKVF